MELRIHLLLLGLYLIPNTWAYQYLGCYSDTPDNGLVRNTTADQGDNGISNLNIRDLCPGVCRGANKAVFGVRKNGYTARRAQCFCADEVPSVTGSGCTYECPRDTGQPCGGPGGVISVYSVCQSVTSYGVSCDQECHCRDNLPCRSLDGFCPNGCANGYYGPACNITAVGYQCPVLDPGTVGTCALVCFAHEDCMTDGHMCCSNGCGRDCTMPVDVNECQMTQYPCGSNELCINSEGSYNCQPCQPGYQLSNDSRTQCEDINECVTDQHDCDDQCFNTQGSYSCDCPEGLQLIQGTGECEDIDECTEGTHDCEYICENTDGGYSCSCNEGFELDKNFCKENQQQHGTNIVPIVVPVVVMTIVVVLAISLAIYFVRRRKNNLEQNKTAASQQSDPTYINRPVTPDTDLPYVNQAVQLHNNDTADQYEEISDIQQTPPDNPYQQINTSEIAQTPPSTYESI